MREVILLWVVVIASNPLVFSWLVIHIIIHCYFLIDYIVHFMEDSKVIEFVYSDMLRVSSGSDYHFDRLRGYWGNKVDGSYDSKYELFRDSLVRLSKSLRVRYFRDSYYIFDGRIWVRINQSLLCVAYDQFLGHYGITTMMSRRMPMQQWFLEQIKWFNELRPRSSLIAFENGVLDLDNTKVGYVGKNGNMLFHEGFSDKFHVTNIRPYKYDENAKCRKWYNFLHEVLPDKNQRLILQMFLGLGLMNRSSVYGMFNGKDSAKIELCLILLGSGANGKSTIYDTAIGIFGKDKISGLDYDDLTAGGDEGMRARSLIGEAIFNWSSDSDQNTFARKRTGVFKKVVSGERVTVRKIGENVMEEVHLPYLVFNLNELPKTDDTTNGMLRRFQFVSFDVTIPKEKQNPALSRELVEEYSGIFNWIVRGCKELRRRKYIFPDSEGHRRQMLLTQLKANPVISWANCYGLRPDACVRTETYLWLPVSTMMKSLEQFCEDNNADMVSKQKFGATMSKIRGGFYKRRFADGMRYRVYGCTEEHLMDSFIIKNEDMGTDYLPEKGTFILEDD